MNTIGRLSGSMSQQMIAQIFMRNKKYQAAIDSFTLFGSPSHTFSTSFMPGNTLVRAAAPGEMPLKKGFRATAPNMQIKPGMAAQHCLDSLPRSGSYTKQPSPFLSLSERFPKGSQFHIGEKFFVDVKTCEHHGVKFWYFKEISSDAKLAVKKGLFPWSQFKIYSRNQGFGQAEREVLAERFIPKSAILSRSGLVTLYGCRVVGYYGAVTSVIRVGEAGALSYQVGSVRPIAGQGYREACGWGGAWLGAWTGMQIGFVAGIETGPGVILTSFFGGCVGGVMGYSAGNYIVGDYDKYTPLGNGYFYDPSGNLIYTGSSSLPSADNSKID